MTIGENLSGVAEKRRTEPRKLGELMRGELDWVVMKCLEKDRGRRYETASALAMDVERHLKDEAVLARPPSTAYGVKKFAKRNPAAVAAGTALVGLTVAVVGMSVGIVRAKSLLK